jgi:hypothetical protein
MVVPVQLDEVEGPQEDAIAMAPVPHVLEADDAIVAAADRLAVDDAGACAQAGESLDDQREAARQIVEGGRFCRRDERPLWALPSLVARFNQFDGIRLACAVAGRPVLPQTVFSMENENDVSNRLQSRRKPLMISV